MLTVNASSGVEAGRAAVLRSEKCMKSMGRHSIASSKRINTVQNISLIEFPCQRNIEQLEDIHLIEAALGCRFLVIPS